MCTPSTGAMLPYGLKIPSPYFPFGGPGSGVNPGHLPASLDFQRSQINDYNVRVQLGLRNYQHTLGISPFHAYLSDPYAQAYFYKHDPRARFVQEEPKPSHSYIGLIGMAILKSKDKKLVLSDIYQWILDNYSYFRSRGPGWRNSIRHNLSLNDCFIKSGRSANGKGHYWAVHPANVDDFERGDFRRRRAQRKVRRHMGLSVPDDDDSPSPSPTQPWAHHDMASPENGDRTSLDSSREDKRDVGPIHSGGIPQSPDGTPRMLIPHHPAHHLLHHQHTPAYGLTGLGAKKPSRKRLFDMASLLAPDEDDSPDIKMDSENTYETNNSGSPTSNRDSDNVRRGEGECCGEGKYKERDDKNMALACHHYEKPNNMFDDDCDNEDDEDNGEEIHVTSDDESSAEQSAIIDVKGNSENCLSGESGDKYSETETSGIDNYDDRDKEISSGIRDKENILQTRIQEMYSKSHILDNDISRENANRVHDRANADMRVGQQDVYTSGLQRYRSPSSPDVDIMHPAMLGHSQGSNASNQDQQPPHTNRSDRLTIPLTITVNTSSLSSSVSHNQNSNGSRHPPESSSSEAMSSQSSSSLPFRGSPFKGEVPQMVDVKPTLNNINNNNNNNVDSSRRAPLDHHSPMQVADILRLQAEGMNWQPFPKDLVRERFSAFKVLDGRSHNLVGHLHQGILRGIPPFTSQALLTHGAALTPGISSPLPASNPISVAANSSPGHTQHSE